MSFAYTALTSLSHDPVTKMSGCCKVDCDTGRHLVLLIFWDTYLAFILSMRGELCQNESNKAKVRFVSVGCFS